MFMSKVYKFVQCGYVQTYIIWKCTNLYDLPKYTNLYNWKCTNLYTALDAYNSPRHRDNIDTVYKQGCSSACKTLNVHNPRHRRNG